jgi:anaerobic selenocysteine-containing dehydrogenase
VGAGSNTDVDVCDTLFLVGHNVAETQTVLWMRMLDRLRGQDPPKLVVVDPRPTPAAREADVWLPIRAGTNVAMLNAIQHELLANGWIHERFLADHGRVRRLVKDGCAVPAPSGRRRSVASRPTRSGKRPV